MGTLTIKKGDNVEVITGKDKGKRGKVIRSVPDKNRVVVEGINKIKKASRPTQRNPQSGGIIEMEAPIHVSNLMLVCGSCGKPTRSGSTRDDEGKRTRICKKCGAPIDKK
jgi:large subunit ribosomal protein L24